MLIENDSPLFESYLDKNNLWHITKVYDSKVEKLFYMARYLWVVLLLFGFVGVFVSIFDLWSWRTTWTMFVTGLVGCAVNLKVHFRDEADREKAQPSLNEYKELRGRLGRDLDIHEDVIEALPIEEIKELSAKELREIATRIVQIQARGFYATNERDIFRGTHGCMYKLGLVAPEYGRYYKTGGQYTL